MDNPPEMRENIPPMREKYTKLLIAALMMGVNLGIKLYFRQRRDANNLVEIEPVVADVSQPATDIAPSASVTAPKVDEDSHIIFVKSEYRMVRIDIRQIRYVEAMSEYLRLHMEGEAKPVIALLSMKRLEERLPQNFMRVHRSYIVNLQKIQQIERGRIVMDKDTYIPVSEGYKEAFNRFLSEKALEK
jgi:DNA-binding LytR/AlgR family response regulator